jgi:hypothetical protein
VCGDGTRHHRQQRPIRFIHVTALRQQEVHWLSGHGAGTGPQIHVTPRFPLMSVLSMSPSVDGEPPTAGEAVSESLAGQRETDLFKVQMEMK